MQDQNKSAAKSEIATPAGVGVMWADPGEIAGKNLLYGSGGEKGQPHPPFTFVEEDTKGSNAKFDVRDAEGEKWKVKLGIEARPETVATRLLWAIGYFTEEDYLLPEIKVENLPAQLHRGQEFVKAGGIFQNACPIRMSYVLNYAGVPIPSSGYAVVSGADKKWYMFRVNEMMTFLEQTFGLLV